MEGNNYATMRHNAKVQKIKKEVLSLRKEAALERQPTSVTVKELLDYIEKHQEDDPLLKKKPSICSIL